VNQLLECVPNFSEGRDMSIVRQITDQIESVEGIKLLDVDPGAATNRTVVTFVGEPDQVCEAAFLAVKKASELIDMRTHKGEHPRFGATDVLPLIPISGITMEEATEKARALAQRIGEELNVSVYCYENAAFNEKRRNLAYCRKGEYEGLSEKMATEEGKPDFGPVELNARSGAVSVGARDFLIAYNVNLNTTSTRRANAIAFDVREKGRMKREGDPLSGKIVRDAQGKPEMIPGSLKCVKGIGWFIEEYGITQISMNLTNIAVTPVHVAFDEACKKADARGVRVTGSELIGLIPLNSMLEAGRYFLKKQKRSLGVADKELIKIAVKSLGLDDLAPFNPDEKIIEYVLAGSEKGKKLIELSIAGFVHETASESAAPGGGSVSACLGALGAAMGTMVANHSAHKKGWDDRWEEYSDWAEKGKGFHDELVRLVDEDTIAFNRIMDAYGLPAKVESDKQKRNNAIQEATRYAIEVPLQVMKTAYDSLTLIKAMAEAGNPSLISDAGVGALAARSAVMGAFLNVKINTVDLEDKGFVEEVLLKGAEIEQNTQNLEKQILDIVNSKIATG
jgi:glutamate formiminotransferase